MERLLLTESQDKQSFSPYTYPCRRLIRLKLIKVSLKHIALLKKILESNNTMPYQYPILAGFSGVSTDLFNCTDYTFP